MEPSPGFLGTAVWVRDEKMVQVSQEIREQKGKSEAGKQVSTPQRREGKEPP